MHGVAAGRECQGNIAAVHSDEFPPAPGPHTQVLLQRREHDWRVSARDPRGAAIRFCGHGALAAARVALDQAGPGSPHAGTLRFSSAAQQWRGRQDAGADRVTLSFARPALNLCDVPRAAARWLGVTPVAAATSGAADDYLVLEVAAPASVAAAEPDAAAIGAATRRALILTALGPTGPVFRYFAPQYGDSEDSATGSAAVQLGSYWRDRAGLEAADYVQLSPGGGCMTVHCNLAEVELSARVEYGAAA
jgi:predicted PhzF superfamily epimerase YddE/YHI9